MIYIPRVYLHSNRLTEAPFGWRTLCSSCYMIRRLLSDSRNASPLSAKKILLLSKTTRFEFERSTRPDLNKTKLKEYLVKPCRLLLSLTMKEIGGMACSILHGLDISLIRRQSYEDIAVETGLPHDRVLIILTEKLLVSKGSDYDGLLHRHKIHKENLRGLLDALRVRGLDVEIVDRTSYNESLISEADAIFTAGGDGTFLLAASRIYDREKPVIGFNTDVERSEGRLLLPAKYSQNPGDAIDNLKQGKFSWQWRQRIRITTSGRHMNDAGMELHELQFRFPEFRYSEHVGEHEQMCSHAQVNPLQPERELPVRALNEVFIGESLSARVSYYELAIDDGEASKQKSSGVTLCTGTGSTSWYFHINHMTHTAVKQLLSAARTSWPALHNSPEPDAKVIDSIHDIYNSQLRFIPEEERMAFCVRDPLISRVFSVTQPRGFAKKITIRSRMWDGQLVIDGGTVFHFNDGAIATFQIRPEDALKCVHMN